MLKQIKMETEKGRYKSSASVVQEQGEFTDDF